MKKRNAVDEALVRRLRAAGCPMPSEGGDAPQVDLRIEVIQAEMTKAYDMRMRSEYVFAVRITNISYFNLVCQGFKASLPWPTRLSWLGDPRIYTPVRQTYRLESGREFPYADVLNHRLFERGKLLPRDSWEGILLAHSLFGRIPFDYPHGSTVPAELAIVDQHGREHASSIEISVDRTATMRPLMLMRPGKGLYDRSTPEQRSVDPESVRPTNSALTGTWRREIVAGNEQLSRASTPSDQAKHEGAAN